MRLEHHLVGGYVRYISPHIIIIIMIEALFTHLFIPQGIQPQGGPTICFSPWLPGTVLHCPYESICPRIS